MNENTQGQTPAPKKPCLVEAGRGFSLFYKERFLYSKYAPERAISGTIENLTILPGTLIIAVSPALWLGLDLLLKKAGEDCFVLGIETDKDLHEVASERLKDYDSKNVALLPIEENDYIVNILSGEKSVSGTVIPHISTFRRAILLEMSAGTQFDKENYARIASLAQNAIASFWKNRITLTRLGRLYSRNLFKNLANLPESVDFKTIAHTIEKPIIVFGAGESIEKTIKSAPSPAYFENFFVIAVDAAACALKANGIKIDAVVAVEGQLAIEKAYIGGSAKKSLLIADILSRPQVTRHTNSSLTYFATKYTDSAFLKNLSGEFFFPPFVPALGSVGLTATFIALLLRKNSDVPVYISGLDFSFSLGRTHAKNTPAHIARLSTSNRFKPAENYDAAFRGGAKRIVGKNGIEVFTDTGLEGYAKSFVDFFVGTKNLYDLGKQGMQLGISNEQLAAGSWQFGRDERNDRKGAIGKDRNQKSEISESIKIWLEGEEKALNRIKELLMFGNDVASCSMSLDEELKALIEVREYLFLHFPDGYKCTVSDISFLKRIRGQIDFFLKDIKQSLKKLC